MGNVYDTIRKLNIHKLAALIAPGKPYVRPETSTELLTTFHMPEPKVDPEDQIACVDNTFGLASTPSYSWDELIYNVPSGAWDAVGRHLRWTPLVMTRAEEALRHMFEIGPHEPIPPVSACEAWVKSAS